MGKIDFDPVISHFSHEHPLHLSNLSVTPASSCCVGCKLKCNSWTYTCKTCCNYSLHISCSRMPGEITHPSHSDHLLTLLPTPAYPEGAFNCNACGKQGTGFSYTCRVCEVDLHILCASLYPLSLSHPSHPACPLHLAFEPPYHNKSFSCDICNNLGSNHWLYRCQRCEFDAHLGCATAKPRSQMGNATASNSFRQQHQPWQQQQQQHPMQRMGMGSQMRIRGNAPINTNYSVRNPAVGIPQLVRPAVMNGSMVSHMMQGFVQGFSQQNGQGSDQQGIFSGNGGGGGGDSNLDIGSSIINGLIGGGGGGGGGSGDIGSSIINGLIGGGGGGSGDIGSSIINGLIGGGGDGSGDIGSSILSNVIGGNGDSSDLGIGASIVSNVIGLN